MKTFNLTVGFDTIVFGFSPTIPTQPRPMHAPGLPLAKFFSENDKQMDEKRARTDSQKVKIHSLTSISVMKATVLLRYVTPLHWSTIIVVFKYNSPKLIIITQQGV